MKYKNRAISLLLSVVMVLTFMPILAFSEGSVEAATAKTPKTISYECPGGLTGTAGTQYVSPSEVGAKITVTYTDGSKAVYEYLNDDENGDLGWYLNGKRSSGEADLNIWVDVDGRLKEGNNKCKLWYLEEDSDSDSVCCDVTVKGVPSDYVLSVSYKRNGGAIEGQANMYDKKIVYFDDTDYEDDDSDYLRELAGDTLTVKYREEFEEYNEDTDDYDIVYREVTRVYICKKVQTDEGTEYRFVDVDSDDDDDCVYPDFYDDQVEGEWTWNGQATGDVTISYDGVDAPQKIKVKVPAVKDLKSVEFQLANGFAPKVSVGEDQWINQNAFYGKGNKLVVTYLDGSTRVFTYDEDEWGFVDKDGNGPNFYADLGEQNITLKKGVATPVTFTYWEEDEDADYYASIDFKYTITATRVSVYAEYAGNYQYTGKAISPKVVVRQTTNDKAIPASAYTYTKPKNKAIGEYSLEVKILDTKNYYCEDDDDGVIAYTWYTISPKKPTIKKPAAAKKAVTVKWKKLSKKDKKNVDGFVIEYSTNKNFNNSKTTLVKKNSATSKKIKKLKSKKTYYVRVYTYKTCKYTWKDDNGKNHTEKYQIWSNPSKTKKIKTK